VVVCGGVWSAVGKEWDGKSKSQGPSGKSGVESSPAYPSKPHFEAIALSDILPIY